MLFEFDITKDTFYVCVYVYVQLCSVQDDKNNLLFSDPVYNIFRGKINSM